VRNVDRYIFGAHIGRSIIDLGRTRPEDVERLKQQIEDGLVGALYIHLAEVKGAQTQFRHAAAS